jgi:DNA helicase HerA-like ATPase
MEYQTGDCITLVGMRKSGKSHKAREILKNKKVFKRVVIFDPVCDWHEGTVVNSWAGFTKAILELKDASKFTLIFRFSPDDPTRPETLNEALRVLYHLGNLFVVIDEIQLFCTPHYMPPYLENLYFIGRHRGVGVVAITQRPSKLNKSCLSQSEHVFVGQLHENNDIKVVANFLNKTTAEVIAIKRREFIYFSPSQEK